MASSTAPTSRSGSGRTPRPFVVLGFNSTHDALAAESVLEDADMEPVPVPAPADISAECGIALRIAPEHRRTALELLSEAGVEPSRIAEVMDV